MAETSHRPPQERGLATRAALLDAALECLVEHGYSATTTTMVAARAGVSRGAQLHHFPTKAELLTASVNHLLERRTAEFRKAFADAEPGADRLDTAIDLLWSMFEGPTFVAWAELWVAARNDDMLRSVVLDMDQRFMLECTAIFTELFPTDGQEDRGFFRVGLGFAMALMDGLALQRLLPVPDQLDSQVFIDILKGVAHLALPTSSDEEENT